MEEYWKSLRTSGSQLIGRGSRYQEIRNFLSKNKKISITTEAKKKIRNDIYEGYQDTDRKEARKFASEHLEELSYITDEELEWCLDWKETLINSAPDISEDPEGKPKLREFDAEDIDWVLWWIIAEPKIEIPESLTFSAILEELKYARREKIRQDKVKAIREYLSTHDDYEEAFLKLEYPPSFKELEGNKFSLSEARMYWQQHHYIPRLLSHGATQAIEDFTRAQGRPPNWGEDLSDYIPENLKEYKKVILSKIDQRLRHKTFRKLVEDPSFSKIRPKLLPSKKS